MLTAGAIGRMLSGITQQQEETVQVLDMKRVESSAPQQQNVPTRYRLILSDGVHYTQAMLATLLNGLVEDGSVKPKTVIKLVEWVMREVTGRKVIIALNIVVVGTPNEKIGNPVGWDTLGDTPLITAARTGRADDVVALLEDGVDVDVATGDQRGRTALWFACRYGHVAITRMLLSANASIELADVEGSTPLIVACEIGHGNIVAQLVAAHASLNRANNAGVTPLYVGSQNGRLDVVERLVAARASADLVSVNAITPLWIASQNGHSEIVAALLAANATIDKTRADGSAPLSIASQNGHAEVVATLLSADAPVDHLDNDGSTPLMVASMNGHTVVVTQLLAANASVNHASVTHAGVTSLIVASQNGHSEVVAKLLAAGASVDHATANGIPPMAGACFHGHLGCVQLLSSYGASRSFPGWSAPRDTAEHLATHRGHHDITAWLLSTRLCSTALHHLEILTAERALALLRDDPKAATAGRYPTPLDLAKLECMSGRSAPNSAARIILEWAAPWDRTTHRGYPPHVRDRVAELMVVGQRIKRHPNDFPIPFELWETGVVKHIVAIEMRR